MDTNLFQTKDYGSIADDLLEAAGYSIFGEEKQALPCAFSTICKEHYKITECDQNSCALLSDIKTNSLDESLKKLLCKKLCVEDTLLKDGIKLVCPRSLQAKAVICEECTNKKCQFFSKKMAFSCILLHAKTFFPDEELPKRVVEIATGFSPRVLERFNKISLYLIRIYLILLKYSMENLKIDYSLIFHTNYIHQLLKSSTSGSDIVETCPKCGAFIKEKRAIRQKIKNSSEYFYTYDYKCDCLNLPVLEERVKQTEMWKSTFSPPKEEEKDFLKNFKKMSYKKFYSKFKPHLFSKFLVRSLISRISINDLYIADVPLGFIFKSYIDLFGEFDPGNFGINEKTGSMLFNLFVGGKNDR